MNEGNLKTSSRTPRTLVVGVCQKDYDEGKVAFKDFETMGRGLLEPYRKSKSKWNDDRLEVENMSNEKESGNLQMCPMTRNETGCIGEHCAWYVIRMTPNGDMLGQCAMQTIADYCTQKIEQSWDDEDIDD